MRPNAASNPSPDNEVGAHYENASCAGGLASLYGADTPLGDFYRTRMGIIAGLLPEGGGELLDAGCGTGQMIRFLRESHPGRFVLSGLDRSSSLIDEARRVVDDDPNVSLTVGRIEEMPYESASFDVVLAMGSLEYVSSIDEALAEIARVTRPHGLAVLTMQNRLSLYRLWETIVWTPIRRRRGIAVSPVRQRIGERRLREALDLAGLTPVSAVYYGFNVFLPPLDSKFPRVALGVQRRLRDVPLGPLRRLASDYLVVAERREIARR